MPEETLSAEALRLSFEAKGLSAQELVALSGAHTVSPSILSSLWYSLCLYMHPAAADTQHS